MFTNQAWQEIFKWTSAIADIAIMWFVIYYTIKIVRNNTRTVQIFKGIILILTVKVFANMFGLTSVGYLADMVVSWGVIAVIIIFQPEIRTLLERLGKSNMFSRISTLSGNEKERLVDEIVKAVMILSKDQTGALISLEQGQSMIDYVKTGTRLNSDVTTELLTSIFVTSTPLHDGAVIIQGDRIACASAYFPPTGQDVPNRYGARHRAAIGISEISDAITIVISEETGGISIAESGNIRQVTAKEIRDYLLRILCNEEIEIKDRSTRFNKMNSNKPVMIIEKEVNVANNNDAPRGFKGLFALKQQDNKHEKRKKAIKRDKFEQLEQDELNVKLPKNKKKNKLNITNQENQVKKIVDNEALLVEDKKVDVLDIRPSNVPSVEKIKDVKVNTTNMTDIKPKFTKIDNVLPLVDVKNDKVINIKPIIKESSDSKAIEHDIISEVIFKQNIVNDQVTTLSDAEVIHEVVDNNIDVIDEYQSKTANFVSEFTSKIETVDFDKIDFEFSYGKEVKIDNVPFEWDYSKKDSNGGDL